MGSSASSSVSGTSASSGSDHFIAGNTSTEQQQQLVELAQAPSDGQRPRTLSSLVWLHFEPGAAVAKRNKNYMRTVHMQYSETDKLSARSVRCGRRFSYIVKRGERTPSTEGMLQHIKTKHPQLYRTTTKISSYSVTTKENRAAG